MSDSEEEYLLLIDDDSNVSESENCEDEPPPKRARIISPPNKYDSCPQEGAWSIKEKKQMLYALKNYGTAHLTAIACSIPTKSPVDIKEYMNQKFKEYKKNVKDKDITRAETPKETPIEQWITHICKYIPNDEHKFLITSRVLKYIALFEERDQQNESESDVNLKDVYLILSSLLAGEGPKYTNRETSTFLYDIFQSFAKEIKQQEFGTERIHLTLPIRPTPVRKCYGKQIILTTSDLDDPVNNPLKVPKDILKN